MGFAKDRGMKSLVVIDVVGLTPRMLGKSTPFLSQWIQQKQLNTIEPVLPAVTCTAQTTYLTGQWPSEHGIVSNGWYFKDECEVKLWRQSNKLVQSDSIWDEAKRRDPSFTCANMFWWYNMYSNVDFSVTPRPQYLADGRKMPDCYSHPSDLRDQLQKDLGIFPLFDFWGPKTSIKSSEWIAEASLKVHDWNHPTLMLIYLPHLDYVLQKVGQSGQAVSKDLLEIDGVCARLIRHFENKGVNVHLISEYGITDVDQPIHINRILREMHLVQVRVERGLELLDAGGSRAFAMADHQIAHVYLNDPNCLDVVKKRLETTPGIQMVLDDAGKEKYHLNHDRAGDLVAVADSRSWFTYYYWLDDRKAPDFARMVDIHKKPGYDPAEMFLDPTKRWIIPRIAWKVLKKKLGFRMVMDVIPIDASLVKGSHGRIDVDDLDKPILVSDRKHTGNLKATDVRDTMLEAIFGV